MTTLCRNLAASDKPQMSRQTRQGPHDNSAFDQKGKKARFYDIMPFKIPAIFYLFFYYVSQTFYLFFYYVSQKIVGNLKGIMS